MVTGQSFGTAAADYECARPTYPAGAVEWMLGESAKVVADVGAGTGKLSGVILASGREVIAIEPDQQMLDTLAQRHPQARGLQGNAEELPLPDGSVDAVTFGQAWHWVDVPTASREAARVLRPGGVLGLIWNVRDSRVPWVAELGDIMHQSAAEAMIDTDEVRIGEPFGAVDSHTQEWVNTLDVGGLVSLAASRSYVIDLDPPQRQGVLDQVRRIGERVAGAGGLIELPYRTEAFRAVLPG